MTLPKEYPDIIPGKKRIKTAVARLMMYTVGMGFQTCAVLDEDMKKELDSWPDTYTFTFGLEEGPNMVIQKRNGRVDYQGERDVFHTDIGIYFKTMEYLFMAVTGRMSTLKAACYNRLYTVGEVDKLMSVLRCLTIVQSTILPSWVASLFYVKRTYKLTPKRLLNRILFYIVGLYGQIRFMSVIKAKPEK